jgi:proline dehydrogenase
VLSQALFFFAKRFVAGQTVDEALRAVRVLNDAGIMATLDVLGENVEHEAAAENAVQSYLALLERIRNAHLQSNVSLKLTQMGLDISRDLCYSNLVRICQKAAECENTIRVDMEGSTYTERTLNLFCDLFERYKNVVGIVIQAYLYRSRQDLERMIQIGARVRLCKGAYKEPPDIAIQEMSAIRQNYRELAELLLVQGHYPAMATHDDTLISWVKEFARNHHISRDGFEFQMLYGVRRETQRSLAREGHKMRVYVPFGSHWLPYFYRRLREREENVSFVLKNLFRR